MRRQIEEAILLIKIEDEVINCKSIDQDSLRLLQKTAKRGSPRYEFFYGVYLLLKEKNKGQAVLFFEKSFKHANKHLLFYMSSLFSELGDEWFEWSIKCLKRCAWRQHPIAKGMLKAMKKELFVFPKA